MIHGDLHDFVGISLCDNNTEADTHIEHLEHLHIVELTDLLNDREDRRYGRKRMNAKADGLRRACEVKEPISSHVGKRRNLEIRGKHGRYFRDVDTGWFK